MDETRLAQEIAARLRAERARLDLSQGEAARRAKMALMSVSRYENGSLPTVAALYRLAEAYGVEATALLPPMATVEDVKKSRRRA